MINFDPTQGPINSGTVVTRNLQPNVTTYTVRASDFTVPGFQFSLGTPYSIEISVLQTTDGSSTNLSNSNVYAISRVYADFTPLDIGGPVVNLPVVKINGSFQYNMTVHAGQTYYIDPEIAIGYDFAIGLGDPNFASVILPAIQIDPYDLSFLDNGVLESVLLNPNALFSFPDGGVSAFRVTGIDSSLGLSPLNTTAFVTGLTFVSDGTFTGTQTPITVDVVPEPGTLVLLGSGIGGLALWRRRRENVGRSELAFRIATGTRACRVRSLMQWACRRPHNGFASQAQKPCIRGRVRRYANAA